MNKLSLYNTLKYHKKLRRVSFHTPGHKNSKKIAVRKLFELDYTELPDTDSLYDASAAIKKSEEFIAQLYGSKYTIFSAGGCTLCIQAMLKLAVPFGSKVLASRMIHKSAVNMLALLNAQVKWVMPRFDKNIGHFEQTYVNEISEILGKNSDFCCVYITSPDYFGHIADIENIAKVCHKYGITLLVDNAHGAHFKFLTKDIHPISLGADLVADSAHKTLPVLTGGAFLHIANEKYVQNAKKSMAIFGSTSPSYPVMASIDVCGDWLRKNGKKAYLNLEKKIAKVKEVAVQKGCLDTYRNVDPVRLTLNTAKIGICGHDAAEYFRKNGIEPEFSDCERVVFIATPMNRKKDFVRLKNAVASLEENRENLQKNTPIFSLPVVKKSLHEALFSSSENVNSQDALGQISAGTVCPCPPGIPILVPGEIITENSIENLLHYGIFSVDVIK